MTQIQKIQKSHIISMHQNGVISNSCPVSHDDLRLIEIQHINFAGKIVHGRMISHKYIASAISEIFRELLLLKFPINSILLMDEFKGNDNLSMRANNSSCFIDRSIAGTNKISSHAYGLAVDINPLQNPYIHMVCDDIKIAPTQGINYLNRQNQRPGMVEPVVEIFKDKGFIWGGDWNMPIDYHHFQIPAEKIAEIIQTS